MIKTAAAKQMMMGELEKLRNENRELSDQFETLMTQINLLTVEKEIARLEFDQIFNAVGDPTWVIDKNNVVLRINRSFLDLLALDSKTAAIGKKCYDLLPSDLCLTSACPLKRIGDDERLLELEINLEVAGRGKVSFWNTTTPLYGLARETIGAVCQFKDITVRKRYEEELKHANRKLERLASVDGLTQLANRRTFDATLQTEWRRMRRGRLPLSVILSDIDFFKRFNDYYGHQAGDACLQAVAKCLKACLHRPGDLVARYGGEEFVVILPDTSAEGARHMAESMRAAVEGLQQRHARSQVSDVVTLSLGAATTIPPLDVGDGADLVKMADKALYESKAAGRNRITTKNLR